MKIDWTTLWEAVKEPLRYLLLAVITWLITVVVPQITAPWATVILLVLRFIDKYLYEKGTTVIPIKGATGLTGF